MSDLIEVRIPTFRRPEMLGRALDSLIGQTHRSWRALVMDDSMSREAKMVVGAKRDSRIYYQPNPTNLGRVCNINQAFRNGAYFPESRYACVLEDDNYYAPELLESNVAAIIAAKLPVLVRNYRMIDVQPDGTEIPAPDEPMRDLYGPEHRILALQERVLECFFNFGIGNLSYFWDLRSGIDLSMDHERYHVHVAESGRSICHGGGFWYEPEPLSYFSRFICKSQTPASASPAASNTRYLAKVSEVRFSRQLLSLWTGTLGRSVTELLDHAKSRRGAADAIQKLAEAGCIRALIRLRGGKRILAAAKAMIVERVYGRVWKAA